VLLIGEPEMTAPETQHLPLPSLVLLGKLSCVPTPSSFAGSSMRSEYQQPRQGKKQYDPQVKNVRKSHPIGPLQYLKNTEKTNTA
jgi:hypothetical protein